MSLAVAMAVVFGLAAITPDAAAIETRLRFDERTSVTIETTLFGLFGMGGRFERMSGEIAVTGSGEARVAVAIASDSVVMNDTDWTEDLRGPDFLDAGRHPEIVFVSDRILLKDPGRGRVTGALTLRGRTRPVTFDFTFTQPPGTALADALARGFTAVTELERSAFGMTAYSGIVSDTVRIEITSRGLAAE